MINLGNAHYRGKPTTFWLGETDQAVYTGPVGETYWLTRNWPTAGSFRHWALATGNRALVAALDQPQPAPQAASQGQDFCHVHQVPMKQTTKAGRAWWSHYDQAAGKWCKGK